MESVGIRELKQRTSEILRLVREQRQEVAITYRGKVVARLVPQEDREARREASRAAWARLERLAEEISAKWPEGVSAVEAIREQRREL
ncbi:MAG: type II toxin-antitoxin system Phd/YefM family antitoxin [Anaerolineae bacterium]